LKNRLKCPFYSLRIGNTDFDVRSAKLEFAKS
jgi:hypothetical protein